MSVVNTKYENQSQQLYINSEGGFGGLGDQINRFRVDLNTSPFSNTDDTILRASVTQFNMVKNFYNVNPSNNAVRVKWNGFTSNGTTISNLDIIVHIREGNYTTHDQLAVAFFTAVNSALTRALGNPAMGETFTFSSDETLMPNTHRNYPLQDRDDAAGKLLTAEAPDPLHFTGKFTLNNNNNFRFNNLPLIQCLSVSTTQALILTDNGVDVDLPAIDFYNDSYILLGGRRVERFDSAILSTTPQSFAIGVENNVLYVQNWFPMNDDLNTTPYIYLRSRNSRTQASSNLEEKNNPHNHSMINSSLLAKIPRVIARNGSVSFILENSPYFTNITAQQLNNIELELTDAKGRPIPPAVTSQSIAAPHGAAVPTGAAQNKDGNLFCDMVMLIEKYQFNNPNALTGFGFNAPQLNPTVFSTNPMMSVDNNGFR